MLQKPGGPIAVPNIIFILKKKIRIIIAVKNKN